MNTEQAIKLVENYSQDKALETKQIVNRGLVNEIYLVTTATKKYILRTDPNENNLGRFKKEIWCMDSASNLGILVPTIFEIGLTDDNHPYMLMEYIQGADGDTSDAKGAIWEKLGEYAQKIHSVSVEGYGETLLSPGIFKDSWSRYLEYNIASLTPDDKARTLNILTEDQQDILREIFIELRTTKLQIGVMHHDLAPKNTIITSEGLVYLIDWGSAGAGIVPHLDIAEILNSSVREDSKEFGLFLKGYGIEYADYETLKPQMKKVSLLVATDKLRWAMDRKPEMIEHFAKKLHDKLLYI